jgi:hypothetical protein
LIYPSNHAIRLEKVKARGFAGTTVRMTVGSTVFNKIPYTPSNLLIDTNALKQAISSDLTENFLRINSATQDGWSWLSEDDWTATETNIRAFAKAAQLAQFRGLIFDPEPYGPNPWLYRAPDFAGKTLNEVSSVVRERGKRFVQVVQNEMPNAVVFFLRLLRPMVQELEDGSVGTEDGSYTLLKPFFEGMLEVANSGVKFVDGDEESYYYLSAKDFTDGKAYILTAQSLFSDSLLEKFKARVSIAHAVYVDGVMDLFSSPRFIGYYLKNNDQRLQLFEHNIFQAARSSDEFVWVYSESMNWWTNENVPSNLEMVMKRGLDKTNSGTTLGFEISNFVNPAQTAFKTSKSISGKVTKGNNGARGAVIRSGISDARGDESACVVYSDLGNFDCVFPNGWSGTLTPTLSGSSFNPPSRVYSNLQKGLGNQDFQVK